MMAAQAAGAASHTMVASSTAVRVGRRSVSRRSYLMLNKAASSFFRGRYRMLEPDDGKLSSPVLRGLAPSNGGRLLGALPGDGTCGQEGRTDLSSVGGASSGQ